MSSHNHNEEKQSFLKMAGMMAICCALPLLIIAFLSQGGRLIGFSPWIVFFIMAVFMIVHFFIMKKMHHNSENNNPKEKSENENKNPRSNKGCH